MTEKSKEKDRAFSLAIKAKNDFWNEAETVLIKGKAFPAVFPCLLKIFAEVDDKTTFCFRRRVVIGITEGQKVTLKQRREKIKEELEKIKKSYDYEAIVKEDYWCSFPCFVVTLVPQDKTLPILTWVYLREAERIGSFLGSETEVE